MNAKLQEELDQAAASGAAYLDEHEPGWHDFVIPATLSMGDACGCVMGQLHGTYYRGMDEHFGADRPIDLASDYGFDLTAGQDSDPDAWTMLDRAWLAQLRQRGVRLPPDLRALASG